MIVYMKIKLRFNKQNIVNYININNTYHYFHRYLRIIMN